MRSDFTFALCQPGAEKALKREMTRRQPGWAPAYQRPGFVTFRSSVPLTPEFALDAVFARQHGLSLGTAKDLDAALSHIRELPAPLCLHVVEREPADPDALPPTLLAREIEQALRERACDHFTKRSEAAPGELVLRVVVALGEPLLLGYHRHASGRSPFPGGRPPIALPPDAPSRAYLKIEEAIASFGLPFRAGHVALEIGAAPGGAAYALVKRGVHVIAVDPAAMDPRLLALRGPSGACAKHLQVSAAELQRAQLPRRVDWLLLDVHLAPQVAMRTARRVGSLVRPTLRGAVLTLKLNDWSYADRIDSFLQQAAELGLNPPQAKQLASHRQEFAIAGVTKYV
jgi:23S rRNA (cytidine2498-2'-O)-methyltransferase